MDYQSLKEQYNITKEEVTQEELDKLNSIEDIGAVWAITYNNEEHLNNLLKFSNKLKCVNLSDKKTVIYFQK